jgi:hypothetical protein
MTVQQFQHDVQLEFSFSNSVALHQSVDVIKAALPDLGITVRRCILLNCYSC